MLRLTVGEKGGLLIVEAQEVHGVVELSGGKLFPTFYG